jgi:hypothetical protein
MRDFIGDHIEIDGRMIGYRISTASEYLMAKGLDEEEVEDFSEANYDIYKLINQIIAIKQSCWILRRTSYSCGSLSDDMLDLKYKLINELKELYDYDFDDEIMEEYCC